MGGVLFGAASWNPAAIIAQILLLQSLFYLSLGLLYWMIVRECSRPVALQKLLPPAAAAANRRRHPTLPPRHVHAAGPYVPGLSLHNFFNWHWISFSSFQGWMVSIACFTNALLAAVYLRLVVSGGGGPGGPGGPRCGPAGWGWGGCACGSQLPIDQLLLRSMLLVCG